MTPLLLTLALLHGADAATTAAALARGGVELNPARSSHVAANITEQAAIGGAQVYLLGRLHQRKPRLAKVLTFAALGVETYAVSRNIRTLRVQGVQ